MPDPTAEERFLAAAQMAEALADMERDGYGNPCLKQQQVQVAALRGGASVLIVAAFENYLRAVFAEQVSRLSSNPPPVRFDRLPEPLRLTSIFEGLKRALAGPPFQQTSKASRLPEIQRLASLVAAGFLEPSAFAEMDANPGPNTVRALFKNVVPGDVFDAVRSRFMKKWRTPVAANFVPDKLEEIVHRRNRVAHTAQALDITRSDLRESLRFMRKLVEVLDDYLESVIDSIIANP